MVNYLEIFDPRSDKGIFVSYVSISRVFWVFNKRSLNVEEFVLVIFYDTNPRIQESEAGEDEINSFKLSKDVSTTEDLIEESVTAEAESTIPTDKANIPTE